MNLEVKRAELALLEAEAAFAAKKPHITDEDRAQLHELRQAFRLEHRQPVSDGAAPGPIAATAQIQEVT